MHNNIKPQKLESLIDDYLFNKWDPISIGDCIEARGEYLSYAREITGIIINGNDENKIVEEIARSLHFAISTSMGMSTTLSNERHVAIKLLEELKIKFNNSQQ